MLKFKNVNVNPKGRKTGDCSTRALVGLLGISYDEALDLQLEETKKCYYDFTSHQVMERALARFGYVKMKQPRKYDNTKYEVREMDEWLEPADLKNGVIVNVAHHYVVIKDDYYQDTWNSGRKCIGNYYEKIKKYGN